MGGEWESLWASVVVGNADAGSGMGGGSEEGIGLVSAHPVPGPVLGIGDTEMCPEMWLPGACMLVGTHAVIQYTRKQIQFETLIQ